jgi:hypothetical protein
MIRHSFVFPPGHSHSTKTREIRKSKGPTQRTESDRGMTSHPRRIPKSVSRFLARGHRPTRYIQVGTRYMLHFGLESQLHRGQKTRGLSHEQKKTMAQHGRKEKGSRSPRIELRHKADSREGRGQDSGTSMPSSGPTTPPYICSHTLYVRIWTLPPFCQILKISPR